MTPTQGEVNTSSKRKGIRIYKRKGREKNEKSPGERKKGESPQKKCKTYRYAKKTIKETLKETLKEE